MIFITAAVGYVQRETGSEAACWHLDVIKGHLAMPCQVEYLYVPHWNCDLAAQSCQKTKRPRVSSCMEVIKKALKKEKS